MDQLHSPLPTLGASQLALRSRDHARRVHGDAMLIKTADDRSQALAELEALVARAAPGDRRRLEKDLNARRAGLRGETESAYHIDFHFAQSRNWAVIHDLRIEHGGRVAQVDHVLLNRTLGMYVLETKHFHVASRSPRKASSCAGTTSARPSRECPPRSCRTSDTSMCSGKPSRRLTCQRASASG